MLELPHASLSDGVEREIKFRLDGRAAAGVRRDKLLSASEPRTFPQTSEYWDTADRALRTAGLSLRLRRVGGRTIQSIKAEAKREAGSIARIERETYLAGDEPDFVELGKCAPEGLLAATEGRIEPRFAISVERTRWILQRDGAELHVDLDIGHIDAAGRHEPLRELEVELVTGPVQALFDVARELAGRHPLRLEFATKSDQGFRLTDDGADADDLPWRRGLEASFNRADAFRYLVVGAISSFSSLSAGFVAMPNAEAIHKMRVAIRRFRTLLRFERDLFSLRERHAIDGELRWIFECLGKARNLDVLLAGAAENVELALPIDALAALSAEDAKVYDEIAVLLRSRRFRVGLVDLLAFVECGSWSRRSGKSAKRREEPVEKNADRALKREWKAIERSERPSHLPVERRHRLRIRAKRLRYACDFYGDLYAGHKAAKRCRKLAASAAALQDALGSLNDRATMATLIEDRFPGRGWAFSPADIAAQELLDAADAAHRKLARRKPFWK